MGMAPHNLRAPRAVGRGPRLVGGPASHRPRAVTPLTARGLLCAGDSTCGRPHARSMRKEPTRVTCDSRDRTPATQWRRGHWRSGRISRRSRQRRSSALVLSRPQVGGVIGDEIVESDVQDLGQGQQRPQRRIRGVSRARLALLVLLICVTGQARAVCHLLLAQTRVIPSRPKRDRESTSVIAPFALCVFVSAGHVSSVVKTIASYGLICMA